jgi:hypothetical protein
MRVAILFALALTACRYSGTFTCDTDGDCRERGSVGRCEVSNGFCTFNDATCSSGFRYADSAGGGVAGMCVMDPSASDGGMTDGTTDGNTFDPAMCPSQYTGMLAGFPNARYLQQGNGAGQNFLQQIVRCEPASGAAQITHAVVVDSAAKAAALETFIGNTQLVFVGLVQDPDAATVGGSWIVFTGEPVVPALWMTGEPDDQDGNENGVEQVGAFGPTGLVDVAPMESYPIVCECDGRPMSPTALDYLMGEEPP